jgi:hypothetical protein
MRTLILIGLILGLVGCGKEGMPPVVQAPPGNSGHWSDQEAVKKCLPPSSYACRNGMPCKCYTPEEWAGTGN